MQQDNGQPIRLLRWIQEYRGFWEAICTADTEYMSPQMMTTLIEKLTDQGFYDIVIVLLTVHRNKDFVNIVREKMLLDLLITECEHENGDSLIKQIIENLQ